MEKGFSVVYKDTKIVKSMNDLAVGDVVKLQFVDGSKTAKITEE